MPYVQTKHQPTGPHDLPTDIQSFGLLKLDIDPAHMFPHHAYATYTDRCVSMQTIIDIMHPKPMQSLTFCSDPFTLDIFRSFTGWPAAPSPRSFRPLVHRLHQPPPAQVTIQGAAQKRAATGPYRAAIVYLWHGILPSNVGSKFGAQHRKIMTHSYKMILSEPVSTILILNFTLSPLPSGLPA